jgi:dihydrofolate reductase
MKTQYYTATSLDGFIATEDDSLEWLFPLGELGIPKVSGTVISA